MFADFRGATRGTGKSFKGALDYFLNDKGQDNERPTTDKRVDVLELRNLVTDNPRNAWFEMMNTATSSDALKESAGIRKGGREGERPVFTYHLAWHNTERPDRAKMLEAGQSSIRVLGLQNYQALIIAHTDTKHPHVHVIVNRVDPVTGKYAALSNSWKQLKGWAIDYSKEHGTKWHVPLEQAKEARDSRKQSQTQSSFNRSAEGKPPQQEREGRTREAPKSPSRAEWQGRKEASNQNNPAEVEAAASLKATLSAKWSAFRQYEQLVFGRQEAEKSALSVDRKAERSAIFEKYNEASQAIWKAERSRPEMRPRPAPLTEKTLNELKRHRRDFERQERSLLGRLANAGTLAKGKSVFAVVRLALNAGERRRLFDAEQRKTASQGRPKPEQRTKAGPVPETRRQQADRLKVMRATELTKFDRESQALRQQMAERHKSHASGLTAMKATLSADGKQAWAQHAARFRGENVRTAQPVREQPQQRPQEATQDRFGRSRDRKPREPRAERQERSGKGEAETNRQTGTKTPENAPQQARGAGEAFTQATANKQPHRDLDSAEAAFSHSREELAELARVQAERAAEERRAALRGDDRGVGRER